MNYALNSRGATGLHTTNLKLRTAIKSLAPFMPGEAKNVVLAFGAIMITSLIVLSTPVMIAHVVDTFIPVHNYRAIFLYTLMLLGLFCISLYTSYFQVKTMGGVGRRLLFNMRNALFTKLQELPVAFFNQNKAGDLISRINNDTDKLNIFFSQSLMQFVSNVIMICGAGIFLLSLHIRLGFVALLPAFAVLIITRLISPWVKRKNVASLQSLGELSAEITESLEHFKVIVAFNRLDYFQKKFASVNKINYEASVKAGIANNVFIPLYGLAFNLAQIIVLGYGIYLISIGATTVGLLIGFILYVNNFYMPLRQLAAVWSSLQLALAGLDRIYEVLTLENNLPIIQSEIIRDTDAVVTLNDVSFAYEEGREIIHHITMELKPGHTYAFVGPTGGGKTTIASLIARLYDPTSGRLFLYGRDIRTYSAEERAQKIGFILQEPFLFTGTLQDNIVYGNHIYEKATAAEIENMLKTHGLSDLLALFPQGLETPVATAGGDLSLGQKQIIAFMRAVVRQPDILILDEATANIDTVTEQILEKIISKLPAKTTKIIIAHRLNTIANADVIYFVNAGSVTLAGSMEHAMELLLTGKRTS
jgi:ATP-binding cassette subfamily B protein